MDVVEEVFKVLHRLWFGWHHLGGDPDFHVCADRLGELYFQLLHCWSISQTSRLVGNIWSCELVSMILVVDAYVGRGRLR